LNYEAGSGNRPGAVVRIFDVTVCIRLHAGIQLFDLPAPEQSLMAQPGGLQTGDENDGQSTRRRPFAGTGVRLVCRRSGDSWVTRIYGVFDLVLEPYRKASGYLNLIAAILEPPVIEKILTHLGLQARAPPRAPARDQALQGA
jgi:hypothetical protein